jgi:hypothetical protein
MATPPDRLIGIAIFYSEFIEEKLALGRHRVAHFG